MNMVFIPDNTQQCVSHNVFPWVLIKGLFVMNNPFMVEQAKRLAKRVAGDSAAASAEQVQSIYSILYSRQPSAAELDLALGFLQLPAESQLTRLEQYSHALLAANEMSYID